MSARIILFFGVTLFLTACHKEKGNESCTWLYETSGMQVHLCRMTASALEDAGSLILPGDSLHYDSLRLTLDFDLSCLYQEMCSSPQDSITGIIGGLWVVTQSTYDPDHAAGDTLNDLLYVQGKAPDGTLSVPRPLNEWLSSGPACTGTLNLYLAQPPSSPGLQAFGINYRETDGTWFSAQTINVNILP